MVNLILHLFIVCYSYYLTIVEVAFPIKGEVRYEFGGKISKVRNRICGSESSNSCTITFLVNANGFVIVDHYNLGVMR